MNSVTGNNTSDIVDRLTVLVQRVVSLADEATFPGNKKESTDNGTAEENVPEPSKLTSSDYMEQISSQFVECATIQAIYSETYTMILKEMLNNVKWTMGLKDLLLQQICKAVTQVKTTSISKLNAKGYARFAAHMHMAELFSRDVMEDFIDRWISHVRANDCGDNMMAVCEVLVHTCLALGHSPAVRSAWKSVIMGRIAPLWEDGNCTNMRVKIRLWDVRDAFSQ